MVLDLCASSVRKDDLDSDADTPNPICRIATKLPFIGGVHHGDNSRFPLQFGGLSHVPPYGLSDLVTFKSLVGCMKNIRINGEVSWRLPSLRELTPSKNIIEWITSLNMSTLSQLLLKLMKLFSLYP